MKYTREKVLYFADRETALHVDIDESKSTDLSGHVKNLTQQGHLEKIDSDDSGTYYKTTMSGKKELLRLQIDWRKRNGKDTSCHEKILEELLHAN